MKLHLRVGLAKYHFHSFQESSGFSTVAIILLKQHKTKSATTQQQKETA